MFQRTAAGLANLHHFFDVDRIAFVEGHSRDMPAGAAGPHLTPDELFWQGLFDALLPDVKIRVISRGSKTTLLPLAEQVRDGLLANTLICMDADYDVISASHVEHNNVIYTWGYSWENDVVQWETVESAAQIIAPIQFNKDYFAPKVDEFLSCLRRTGERLILLDINYQRIGTPLFYKSNVTDIMIFSKGHCPAICLKTVLERIADLERVRPHSLATKNEISLERHFHGKTFINAIWMWLHQCIIHPYRTPTLPKNIFLNYLIRSFVGSVSSLEHPAADHYRQRIPAIS